MAAGSPSPQAAAPSTVGGVMLTIVIILGVVAVIGLAVGVTLLVRWYKRELKKYEGD